MNEIETIVEPDSVTDDIGRKSVALVSVHPPILAQISDLTCQYHRVGSGFKRALVRVGITDFRFHELRHTRASWHVTNGTSLQELMALGGWKSYEMVLRYAHLAPDHLSHAAACIERNLAIVESNSTKTLRSDEEKIDAEA